MGSPAASGHLSGIRMCGMGPLGALHPFGVLAYNSGESLHFHFKNDHLTRREKE